MCQIDMVILEKKSEINIFDRHSYMKHCAVIFFRFHPHILFLDTFKQCTLFHRAPQQWAGGSFKMPNLSHLHTTQTFLCAIYEHITQFFR